MFVHFLCFISYMNALVLDVAYVITLVLEVVISCVFKFLLMF